MKVARLLLLYLALFLSSCWTGDFVKLNDRFALWATDDRADMSLCFLEFDQYWVGVVGPCIFAAGVDDNFIILKEHPTTLDGINREVTLYYILPLKNSINSVEEAREKVIGPLTEKEFGITRRQYLVAKSLDFKVVFSDLE
ncbi:hypothetical protein SAMN05216327_10927 [Dyadobacter sp. SG02]|uniref:hypothetical protein n=1 Tax=Dyadobacter sp. SG02 TaxID=1855291 RepID=UPI0008D5BC09|nr:hypothetical protein [Dyadobacter sp. SG02]SEJ36059.1 hypothetical protein SAMN05216327_10927 [Dyadobacter sp. SG02]